MTKAERTELARKRVCPKCHAEAGRKCRQGVPQYTPLGSDHPRYGRPMKNVHAERLALIREPGTP